MTEIWKPIEGCEGYYVSTEGRVMSDRQIRGKILKPRVRNKSGHLSVNLYGKEHLINKLVLCAFKHKRRACQVVGHLDWDTSNNKLDNLIWESRSAKGLRMRNDNRLGNRQKRS